MATNNINTLQALINEQIKLNDEYLKATDIEEKRGVIEKQILNDKMIQREQERLIGEIMSGNLKLSKEDLVILNNQINKRTQVNNYLKEENKLKKLSVDLSKNLVTQIKEGWKYLQLQDKVIKSTILNLGLSGNKAREMRLSFEDSISAISMLGGNIEDIATVQTTFANETGKARALTSEMVVDIMEIAKGTGISVEEASKLGAQFEFMGIDAVNTNKQIQGIVDTSERMGVNTQKVIKNINDNFKRINTYNFKGGVKSIANMAMTSEKFRVSMTSALDVSDKMKTLEGAIDAVAHLQVLGGEFAKVDMFESLYVSRNEPDKWNKKISEMTKGMATFRKNSEGVFQTFISAEDRQRLELASKALGISNEELTQIAQKRAELDLSERQLGGKGLTSKQKELIQGAMKLNTETGKLQVSIGGNMQDIASLTATQASAFESEQVLLKDRAKEAQTFDEAFKNTINALKGALLPLLKGINGILNFVRPIFEYISTFSTGGAITAFIAFGAAATIFKAAVSGFSQVTSEWVKGKVSGGFSRIFSKGTPTSSPTPPPMSPTTTAGNANAGKGLMRGGIGIGAAALGVGAGIGIAAVGISKLADSMAKLDKTQIAALPNVMLALGGAFAFAAIGIGIMAKVSELSAEGLAILALAALGIGAGIGIAAAGIGYMTEGLSKLVASSKDVGWSLVQVGAGIAAINASMALGAVGGLGGFLGGFKTLSKTLAIISTNADSIMKVGEGFKNISAALTGNKEDFIAVQNAVESISKVNTSGGGMLAELATLLKSPLKVEFVDKNVAVVSEITLNIDGQKFMQKVYKAPAAVQKNVEAKTQGLSV